MHNSKKGKHVRFFKDHTTHSSEEPEKTLAMNGDLRWMTFSPDGKAILCSSKQEGAVQLVDVASGNLRWKIGKFARARHAFTPDSKRVLFEDKDEGFAILDAKTGEPLHTLPGSAGSHLDFLLTPDGKTAIVPMFGFGKLPA